MDWIAHRREDTTVQTLIDHLKGTSELAASYAVSFGGQFDARRAGMLHDIGKYSEHFQKRIRDPDNVPPHDHATAGAKEVGVCPVGFAVAGHHGGLPDGGNRLDPSSEHTLFGRIKRIVDDYSRWQAEVMPVFGIEGILPTGGMPSFLQKADPFTWSFYTRMIFSCLVDADFIDTETFMQGEQPRGQYESIPTLSERLEKHLAAWQTPSTPLNIARTEIRGHCEAAIAEPPGLFSLTVPTGGGKTLSSLRFALGHAEKHRMERVIYVIPYTSIIDQTAEVFTRVLGENSVLEHHSSADYDSREQSDTVTDTDYRKRLATENWDAPIIVTTAVQFFESLFADRPSKCRKLHNIANSVIVFDEAQTIPVNYLAPCVAAISQLVNHYHCTAVLCTATQSELGPMFEEYSVQMREIIPEPAKLYTALRRTTVQRLGQISWEDLGNRLANCEQVLCIVGRRKSAKALFEALPQDGSYCLSTLLYPAHRKRIFAEIRDRLTRGLPCRVVSTSLIEAGVDLDFPTVYREKAGLDSILQAAGRCNREGKRTAEESVVFYFDSEDGVSPFVRQNVSALDAMSERHENLGTPDAIRDYFRFLWYIKSREALDVEEILPAFQNGIKGCAFPFRQVAARFRLINSPAKTVYIPIGDGAPLTEQLRQGYLSRTLFRKLGQYGVTVYPDHMEPLLRAGAVTQLESGDAILCDINHYNEKTGLSLDVETGVGYFV